MECIRLKINIKYFVKCGIERNYSSICKATNRNFDNFDNYFLRFARHICICESYTNNISLRNIPFYWVVYASLESDDFEMWGMQYNLTWYEMVQGHSTGDWRWPRFSAARKWWVLRRAALRLVRARVLCQMRAPYRPITRLPLPPIAGPQNCGPGCCSTPSTPLMRHCN